jgi:hypothetical protein
MLYPWQTFLRLANPFIVPENIVLGLVSRSDRPDAMSLAAAYTGLDIEYVDGVRTLDEKALPPGGVNRGLKLRSIYPHTGELPLRARPAHDNLNHHVTTILTNYQDRRAERHLRPRPRRQHRLGHPYQTPTDRFHQSISNARPASTAHDRSIPRPNASNASPGRRLLHRLQSHRSQHSKPTHNLTLRRYLPQGSPLARPLRLPLPKRQRPERPPRPHCPCKRLHLPRAKAPRQGIRQR